MTDTIKRIVAVRKAAELVGGQRALAGVLNVGERSVRAWIGCERPISDSLLGDIAAGLEAHAGKCQDYAAKIRRELTDTSQPQRDAPGI